MLQECIHYWYIDAEGKGKGDNLFSDFIRECGEGLHHIQSAEVYLGSVSGSQAIAFGKSLSAVGS